MAASTTLVHLRKATRLRPLHDRVAINRLEQEEKTAGGIMIPDTAKESR